MLVYSIDSENTFDELQELHEKITSINSNISFFLVGNKNDLDKQNKRVVLKAQAKEMKDELECSHFAEVSATTNKESIAELIE